MTVSRPREKENNPNNRFAYNDLQLFSIDDFYHDQDSYNDYQRSPYSTEDINILEQNYKEQVKESEPLRKSNYNISFNEAFNKYNTSNIYGDYKGDSFISPSWNDNSPYNDEGMKFFYSNEIDRLFDKDEEKFNLQNIQEKNINISKPQQYAFNQPNNSYQQKTQTKYEDYFNQQTKQNYNQTQQLKFNQQNPNENYIQRNNFQQPVGSNNQRQANVGQQQQARMQNQNFYYQQNQAQALQSNPKYNQQMDQSPITQQNINFTPQKQQRDQSLIPQQNINYTPRMQQQDQMNPNYDQQLQRQNQTQIPQQNINFTPRKQQQDQQSLNFTPRIQQQLDQSLIPQQNINFTPRKQQDQLNPNYNYCQQDQLTIQQQNTNFTPRIQQQLDQSTIPQQNINFTPRKQQQLDQSPIPQQNLYFTPRKQQDQLNPNYNYSQQDQLTIQQQNINFTPRIQQQLDQSPIPQQNINFTPRKQQDQVNPNYNYNQQRSINQQQNYYQPSNMQIPERYEQALRQNQSFLPNKAGQVNQELNYSQMRQSSDQTIKLNNSDPDINGYENSAVNKPRKTKAKLKRKEKAGQKDESDNPNLRAQLQNINVSHQFEDEFVRQTKIIEDIEKQIQSITIEEPQILTEALQNDNFILNPFQLKLEPRQYWVDFNYDIKLVDIVNDFFRNKKSKSIKFIYKLYDMLLITSKIPMYKSIFCIYWINKQVFLIDPKYFAAVLNEKDPTGELTFFGRNKLFDKLGFVEVTSENFHRAGLICFPKISDPNIRLLFQINLRFINAQYTQEDLDFFERNCLHKNPNQSMNNVVNMRQKYPGYS